MDKLQVVSKDAGMEVLRVWLFDLPELAYLAGVNSIDKKKDLAELKYQFEGLKNSLLLSVSANFSNQALREAEVDRLIREKYPDFFRQINELTAEVDKLKAQENYYESVFKSVKDVVYYQSRVKELADMRDIKRGELSKE